MRLWIGLLAMASACGFKSGGTGDGGTMPPPPDAQTCFGTFTKVCFTTAPSKAFTVTGPVDIDTDATVMCDQQNDKMASFCVVGATAVSIPALQTLRAHGSKPLLLVSSSTISIAATGTLDVHSNGGATSVRGAGANPADCVILAAADGMGGGFGGSFGGKGGDGEKVGGSAGGLASPALTTPPAALRGGCAGGNGANDGGLGGNGGGAVELIAATSIQLDGTINASGAGGHGSPATKSGGGGGGSGGMIVLESPSILGVGTGTMFANGGGGGQGGTGGGQAALGMDGAESPGPTTAGAGGVNAATDGGFGGSGSFGPNKIAGLNAGGGAGSQGGGGAGGGGVGFIRARSVPGTITTFPAPMDLP